jgi:nondiscriminating aspartyl-tRNA synthetase
MQEGFTEIHTPKIVATGTEGGAELFSVRYFEQNAYLAQSPQFYKQIMVGSGLERVFEIGHAYRAEEHNTTRHLNEYISLDLEMGFIENEQDVIELQKKLIQFMFSEVSSNCAAELKLYKAKAPQFKDIPQLTLTEAKEILRSKCNKDLGHAPDLDPEGERLLCKYIKKDTGEGLVYITGYPTSKRPFYTMPREDSPEVSRSFDLLYDGEEITTGGQRIHNYEQLIEKMKKVGLNEKDFDFYLQAFKYGMPPHGGLAIGAERITKQLLGLSNVREASLFPRDRTRVAP